MMRTINATVVSRQFFCRKFRRVTLSARGKLTCFLADQRQDESLRSHFSDILSFNTFFLLGTGR